MAAENPQRPPRRGRFRGDLDPRIARREASRLATDMNAIYTHVSARLRGHSPTSSGSYDLPNEHMRHRFTVFASGRGYLIAQESAVGERAATIQSNRDSGILLFSSSFPHVLSLTDDPQVYNDDGESFYYFNRRGSYRKVRTGYVPTELLDDELSSSSPPLIRSVVRVPIIAGDFEAAKIAVDKLGRAARTITDFS